MSTAEDRLSPHNSAASENSRRSNLMTQLSQSRKKSRAEEAKTKSAIQKVALLRYCDHVETAQEGLVSVELVLYESPWKIKKKLEKSDVGSQSRLLVPKALVKTHVLPLMTDEMVAEIGSDEGMSVTMQDLDTDFKDLMVFKYWWSTEAFILNKCWIEKFVKRRNLKPNDEIGLIWDPYSMQFYFSVLNRAE